MVDRLMDDASAIGTASAVAVSNASAIADLSALESAELDNREKLLNRVLCAVGGIYAGGLRVGALDSCFTRRP
jgi:hypothetical protein